MKWRVISLLALTAMVTAMVCCCDAMSIEPSMEFKHNASIVANDIYNLFWTLDDDNATFEVHAKTLGYVGFGISKTGGMRDADIVIGWVKDGKAYFQDRYASRNGEPEIDESQDWKLEEGREEGEYTILRFSRALQNCDPFDVDITQDTMRIIYAFHDMDPEESTGLTYHGKYRGTKSLSLVNYETPTARELPSDAFYVDFLVDKVQVPAKDTTYYCYGFPLPKLDKKHHIVMVEPIIQPGNEGLLHHFMGHLCPAEFKDTKYGTMHGDCLDEAMRDLLQCKEVVYAYALGGGGAFYMPDEAGFPLSGEDSPLFIRLEMHYDNPQSQAGLVDSSGARFWLTPTLRTYDAGMLLAGLWFDKNHVLPPNFEELHNEGYCVKECLSRMMGSTSEVEVFSVLLHTHVLGTALTVRHIRDGTELPPIAEDKYYDFNFQGFRHLKKPVTIKKGDELIVECTYNTNKQTGLSFGGLATQEEMCLAFLMVYPKFSTKKTRCQSVSPPANWMSFLGAEIKVTGAGFQLVGEQYEGMNYIDILNTTDWTNKNIREKFQKAVVDRSAVGIQLCSAHPDAAIPLKVGKIRSPYVREDPCNGNNPGNPTRSSSMLLAHSLLASVMASGLLIPHML